MHRIYFLKEPGENIRQKITSGDPNDVIQNLKCRKNVNDHQAETANDITLKLGFLTLSVPEILENSIFVAPIIPQTLNINNLRTTSAKNINLHTIRKLIKYSLKNSLVKIVFIVTVFEILLFEGRLVLSPAQRGTGNERVKYLLSDNITAKSHQHENGKMLHGR